MTEIILKGHKHFFSVEEIMRLFFGVLSRQDDRVLSAFEGENPTSKDKTVRSILDGFKVRTEWRDKFIEKDLEKFGGDPKYIKREIKIQLYLALSDLTGVKHPWGSLTGIRPTSIAEEEDFDPELLVEKYFLSRDKAELACRTGIKERQVIDSVRGSPLFLFVSVPICPSRCFYCSFSTSVHRQVKHLMDPYVKALLKEIELFEGQNQRKIAGIYMGGGTPTVLDDEDFEKILSALARLAKKSGSDYLEKSFEFTVEAGRPETISDKKTELMKAYGVNRVCVNPQTFNDASLNLIGRQHSAADVTAAFEKLKAAGFKTINMDLISGLEGESKKDFLFSLEKALSLGAENITLHSLSVKRASRLNEALGLQEGKNPVFEYLLRGGEVAKMLEEGYKMLEGRGYVPYYLYRQKNTLGGQENVGYTLPGHEGIYNCIMMGNSHDVEAFGAKAISKKVRPDGRGGVLVTRRANPGDLKLYIEKFEGL